MSFEVFVFRVQVFAAKLQSNKPENFISSFKMSFGAIITQFLMGLCFAKTLQEGEKQWRKRSAAKLAVKKSEQAKKNVQSAK